MDPTLLWCMLAAAVLIGPLAWEPLWQGAALKEKKTNKKKKEYNSLPLPTPNSQSIPRPPLWQPQVCSLCLCVCSCFVSRFICARPVLILLRPELFPPYERRSPCLSMAENMDLKVVEEESRNSLKALIPPASRERVDCTVDSKTAPGKLELLIQCYHVHEGSFKDEGGS